jgi:hypothetical protein
MTCYRGSIPKPLTEEEKRALRERIRSEVKGAQVPDSLKAILRGEKPVKPVSKKRYG